MGTRTIINWRLFFALWAASAFASAAAIPYALNLGLMTETSRLPVAQRLAIALHVLMNIAFFAVVVFLGLFLGRRVSLGAPFLEGWLAHRLVDGFRRMAFLSVFSGALCGLALFVLDRFVFALAIPPITAFQAGPPVWTRVLVSFYGGICEELGMRLGIMTFIVWLTWLVRKSSDNKPTSGGVWIAIVLVSIPFGLGHLPMTSQFMEVTSLVVFRALVLNGIAGVLFGWLFWRHGLEAAIAAHFSTDIVLHVLLPGLG